MKQRILKLIDLFKAPDGLDAVAREKRFWRIATLVITLGMVIAILVCLLTGRYNCTRLEVFIAFIHGILDRLIWVLELPSMLIGSIDYSITNPIPVTWGANVDTVIWTIRIPRILAAGFIGGGLAISGASYQSLFRNPLVSESILGVSSGASLGACIGILIASVGALTTTLAFIGGVAAVACTYTISKFLKGNQTLLLVLASTVVTSLFSAGISIVKYIAPTDTALPEITFWLMGSFAKVTAKNLVLLIPIICVCTFIIFRIRWQMNVLALGDSEAKTLGINIRRTRLLIIISSTLITAISVCVCGMIGWVGVIIPQITRMLVGPDNRRLVPCAFFSGTIFMLIVDLLCRNVLVAEIPIGIVTSLIGAPIFVMILKRAKEGWL